MGTLKEFPKDLSFKNGLDSGCGDGSISRQLLRSDTRVTFLDLSARMTEIARSKVPAGLAANAQFINENVLTAPLEPASYDLIVCLGVMAHVDSPEALVATLASLLQPGGRLILEFSDARHPLGRYSRAWQWVAGLRKPRSYRLNTLWFARVNEMLQRNGFTILSKFRYSHLFVPVVHRRLSETTKHKVVRTAFGEARQNRRHWLGNEYICLIGRSGE